MPKGSSRKLLEQQSRVKVVKIDRTMTSSQSRESILTQFKWVHSYTVLMTGSDGNTLVCAPNQSPTGNKLVDKRGLLYLHEVYCRLYMYMYYTL